MAATTTNETIPGDAGQQLNETKIRQLVEKWYQLLDVHASENELLPLLSDAGLEMQFPEGPLHGLEDFKRWYQTVTHTFFDEKHVLKEVTVTLSGDRADVKILVNWQAKRWRPPVPKSDSLDFDAAQSWVVIRSPSSGKPVILTYIVDSLRPLPGSDPL
jgi:SnoaL-like domain